MKRVKRVVSAVVAGASLAWGIAKALRKGAKRDADAPSWPEAPKDAQPSAAAPEADAPPVAAEPPGPSAEESAPERATAPEPAEAPQDAPEPATEVVLKGVVIGDPERLLAFVNGADTDAFTEAGVKGRALTILEESRPFASVDDLAGTSGIGRRTLHALRTAADA